MRIAKITHTFAITQLLIITITLNSCKPLDGGKFNAQRALKDMEFQVGLGPRVLGSAAHENTKMYILEELSKKGWSTASQEFALENGRVGENIIANRGVGDGLILLGAHYDTRFFADQDPDPVKQRDPVPGANDGASGVAVLLELSRVLPDDLGFRIQMVFFDAEDNGNIPGYDWILGSRYYVTQMIESPDVVVIVDMVGDKNLNLYKELNSDDEISSQIWQVAAQNGYPQFVPEAKHRIIDDHLPFVQLGIPAVDIIDFDYPYWHTTQDTLDKVSEESLTAVGNTLLIWLTSHPLP